MVTPQFQPVGVDFPHIRCNCLPDTFSLIVVEIVPAPFRFFGKGINGRQQIVQFLSTRVPVFFGQFNTAHISVTPFIDNGVGMTVDFTLQKHRFKFFRIFDQEVGNTVHVADHQRKDFLEFFLIVPHRFEITPHHRQPPRRNSACRAAYECGEHPVQLGDIQHTFILVQRIRFLIDTVKQEPIEAVALFVS